MNGRDERRTPNVGSVTIALAASDDEIRACHPVLAQLRPGLEPARLLALARLQEREGYRVLALREDGVVAAVAGFRICHNLAWGRHLYVDDLVTDSARQSRGHGRRLMHWMLDHAARENCEELHLDSGVQRFGAHRFYLRLGLDITSHHFRVRLRGAPPTS
jgi:GNAT superfamily N-acetyltransferase